jgi:hypothetical protein
LWADIIDIMHMIIACRLRRLFETLQIHVTAAHCAEPTLPSVTASQGLLGAEGKQ